MLDPSIIQDASRTKSVDVILKKTGIKIEDPGSLMAAIVYSNKYEVQKEIAQGGMGIVFQAWDRMLERVVALKVIHKNLIDDSNFLARFFDEARKMALLHHPNIIQIYSVEKDQGIPFLVMEYFPGANLKTHLCQNDALALKESVRIVCQIAHALAFTHRKGIIHRDIKPANILLDNTLNVKLTDFGIARALGQTAYTATGQLLGTVKYMSPEQARDIPLDGRSDLYSLGMLFYELVTGTNPRNEVTAVGILSMLITEGHMPSLIFPASLNIPQEIQQIIIDLLQFHPTDRIPNAETLIERLEKSFPGCSRPLSIFEVENTNDTLTLDLGHRGNSLANKPTVTASSTPLTFSDSLPPATESEGMFEQKESMDSLQNLSSIQSEPTPKSEPHPPVSSRKMYSLLVCGVFLLLAIGGYAWHYVMSPQSAFRLDNQIATKPVIENSKAEKSFLSLAESKPQQGKRILREEFDSPIQQPSSSLATRKLPLAKILVKPSRPTPLPQNNTKDKSSPIAIGTGVNPLKPIQLADPFSSTSFPPEESQDIQESQVDAHPALGSSSLIQTEKGLPMVQVPIPPTSPKLDFSSTEPVPSEENPMHSVENREESLGAISPRTSQEIMRRTLHIQVEQLQQAIIEKNWAVLERMSLMSEARRFWLEALYDKYDSVQIDIARVDVEVAEGRAIIHFTKGIRPNGEIVIPNKIGKIIKISIPKNGNQWGRIIW